MSAIPARDVEISFFRSSGPGGQKKNTTDSAVRVRHRPTGIVVVATASRSQHRNKELALKELERRIAARRVRPRPRVATRPSLGARHRRLKEKRIRSERKQTRRGPGRDDE